MPPNNHRSMRVTPEQFDKPWKVRRLIGKWVKCAVCSGRAAYKERKAKWNAKRRRENKDISRFED
jgi:hypothetical protein